MDYFSDRARGPVPRIHEDLTEAGWGGLVAHFLRRVDEGGFGSSFPEMCSDGNGPCGTDAYTLRLAMRAEIPSIEWPLDPRYLPDTATAFDVVEFAFQHVGAPRQLDWHSFMRHHHLAFDRAAGQAAWRDDVNRVFQRGGIAFELGSDGRVARLVPQPIAAQLRTSEFDTGDSILDSLLDDARALFFDREAASRRGAVEKLWDAFERAKTLRNSSDKKLSADQLLDESSSTTEFRQLLGEEARALTQLGNNFRIRHSEQTKVELVAHEFDYVFARMFALLWHVLRGELHR